MIENFDNLSGRILDPTVGCGGLIAACIIAGSNPKICYGIELDEKIAMICRERLSKLGVPRLNIKIGDALKDESYNFNEDLENKSLIFIDIKDLGLSEIEIDFEIHTEFNHFAQIKYTLNLLDESVKIQLNKIFKILNAVNNKNINVFIYGNEINNKLLFLNKLFKKYLNIEVQINSNKLINFI